MLQPDGGRTGRERVATPEEQVAAILPEARRRPGSNVEPGLRQALDEMCVAARDRGWHAERLILELKQIWRTNRRTSSSRDRIADQALLDRAVSYCIEEFYRAS